MKPEGFPRSLRLRRSADYRRVQRSGRRWPMELLVVIVEPNGLDAPRYGMAVSRKVGNAVMRNRVKRWLRESIRRRSPLRVGSVDVVFIARTGAAQASFEAIDAEVDRALCRIAGR